MTDVTPRIEDSDGNNYIADVESTIMREDSVNMEGGTAVRSREYIFKVGELFEA